MVGGDLDLAHRQLPPVAVDLVVFGQRQRQQTHPPVEEPLDSARSETVTDLLKPGRVRAGGEAVGQRGPLDPHLRGLAFGPLVPVEPNLDRVGEVRADLDERGTEVNVPQVEVETRHPPVRLGEREPRDTAGAVALRGREHVLVFLCHTDRHHAGTAGSGLCGQVSTHDVDLAVTLVEADHRDVVGLREQRDRVAKRCAHLLHDRWRGNRIAQVPGHEPHHLPGDLKVRHIAVEIDPVQALQIQGHVTIQKIVHRQRISHHPRMTQARPTKPARASAVRGTASLVARVWPPVGPRGS
jgi:hypothetical protein